MVKVRVESVRVSLMSQHRIAVLQEDDGDRYLPIWIGSFEAEAIAMRLRNEKAPRPLTHDLVHLMVDALNGLAHVVIYSLEKDIYLARLVFNDLEGDEREMECRPSDAIAIAVRCECPIYVSEEVMDAAAKVPAEEVRLDQVDDMEDETGDVAEDDGSLDVFRDALEDLDLDSLFKR